MPDKGDYSPSATIIPLEGGNGFRPRTLISAISEIQQFFVIESQGQTIPAEFLTLEGSLDLFRIGMRSGFTEGLLVIMLFPVFSLYILPFVLQTSDLVVRLTVALVPYLALSVNTLICVYISRYYVGNITRRAINSLFLGRGTMLFLKGFLIYVFYQVVFRLSTPEYVGQVAQLFAHPEKIYSGYFSILPQLIPLATETAICMCFAAVSPYLVAYLLDHFRQYRTRSNISKIQ